MPTWTPRPDPSDPSGLRDALLVPAALALLVTALAGVMRPRPPAP